MNVRGLLDWCVSHFKAVMLFVWGSVAVMIIVITTFAVTDNIHPTKTIVDLNITPVAANITLNGQLYRNGTYEIEPGTYSLKIEADGFVAKEYDIEVKANQTTSVNDYLLNSENGLQYYMDNPSDMTTLYASNDEDAKNFVSAFERKYALYYNTPFDYKYGYAGHHGWMKVDFGDASDGCQTRLCIVVDDVDSPESREALSKALSDRGFDVGDYEVIYE